MSANPQHTRLAAMVVRQVAKHGRDVTLLEKVTTGPDYNPTQLPPIETIVKAVASDYNLMEQTGPIQVGDKKFLIAPPSNVNASMQILDADGSLWEIVKVNKIQPGEVVLGYRLQVRR